MADSLPTCLPTDVIVNIVAQAETARDVTSLLACFVNRDPELSEQALQTYAATPTAYSHLRLGDIPPEARGKLPNETWAGWLDRHAQRFVTPPPSPRPRQAPGAPSRSLANAPIYRSLCCIDEAANETEVAIHSSQACC